MIQNSNRIFLISYLILSFSKLKTETFIDFVLSCLIKSIQAFNKLCNTHLF